MTVRLIRRASFVKSLSALTFAVNPMSQLVAATHVLLREAPRALIITDSQAQTIALVANGLCRLRKPEASYAIFVSDSLTAYIKAFPKLNESAYSNLAKSINDQLFDELTKLPDGVKSLRTNFDAACFTYAAISRTGLIPASILTQQSLKWCAVSPKAVVVNPPQTADMIWATLTAQTLFSSSQGSFDAFKRATLNDFYNQRDKAGGAIDSILKPIVGDISAADAPSKIFSQMPGLHGDDPVVHALLNGNVNISLDDLQTHLALIVTPVASSLDAGSAIMHDIFSAQGPITGTIGRLGDDLKTRIGNFVDDSKNNLDSLTSAGNIASQFANLIVPGFGDRLSSFIDGASNFADSIGDFIDAASDIEDLGDIVNLGSSLITTGLTGGLSGLLGAAGILGGGGSDTAMLEAIRKQLNQIQTSINNLQAVMLDRFNEIDSKLDSMYTSLSSQISNLTLITTKTLEEVEAVKASLFDLQAEVEHGIAEQRADQVANRFAALDDILNLALAGNGAFPAMSEEQFESNVLHLFPFYAGGKVSTGFGVSAPGATNYDIAKVASDFTGALSSNISYLSDFMYFAMRLPSLGEELPNYDLWATSARALIQLMLNNERLAHTPGTSGETPASRYSSSALDVGNRLRGAVASVTRRDGDLSKPCNALFQWLFAGYRAVVAKIDDNINSDYRDYKKAHFPLIQNDAASIDALDLWGDYTQATPFQPTYSTTVNPDPDQALAINDSGDTDARSTGAIQFSIHPDIPNTYRLFSVVANAPITVTFGNVDWYGVSAPRCGYLGNGLIDQIYDKQIGVGLYLRMGRYVFEWTDLYGPTKQAAQVDVYGTPGAAPPCGVTDGLQSFPGGVNVGAIDYFKQTWQSGQTWKLSADPEGFIYGGYPTLDSMKQDINTGLSTFGADFIKTGLTASAQTGNLHNVAQSLQQYVRLLQGYCSLGLSQSLERDDVFRGLLFGDGAILGTETMYTAVSQLKPNQQSLLSNVASQRIDDLEKRIDAALKRVWYGKSSESLRTIESTCNLLETYRGKSL